MPPTRGGLVRDGGRAGCDIGGGSCRVVATSSAFWRAAGEPPTDDELRLLTDIGTATDTLVIENVQGKLEGLASSNSCGYRWPRPTHNEPPRQGRRQPIPGTRADGAIYVARSARTTQKPARQPLPGQDVRAGRATTALLDRCRRVRPCDLAPRSGRQRPGVLVPTRSAMSAGHIRRDPAAHLHHTST